MIRPSRTSRKPPDRADHFDSPWKTLLERWFPAFLAWFFPRIAAEINWARGYVFLDQELRKISRRAQEKRRHADKLVKVWRRTGEERWVLVHGEIQAGHETDFAERMFIYYYRLFDRYRLPLASLVVLADDRPQWRPDHYERQLWGCDLQGMALTLRRQLRRRFGDPPAWVEAKLREGTPPQLERWADQLLDAETLEAVFKK